MVDIGPGRIELVQVKAKDLPLVLSDIAPVAKSTKQGNEDSLLGHVRFFLEKGYEVFARVVAFGSLGDELAGFMQDDSTSRQTVLNKIRLHFGDGIASFCESGLQFEVADRNVLLNKLETWAEARVELRACPPVVIDRIVSRVRRLSLEKGYLTLGQIEEGARSLGLKLAAVSGVERQYGNTIIPLEKMFEKPAAEDIADEYRLGVNARPEHIAEGLDIRRPHWTSKIGSAFKDERIVIVRGASGQGKSTLCYRYLYESGSIANSYAIVGLDSLEDARDICAFVVVLSEAQSDIVHYVYVDGASGEGWAWLAQQLYERSGPNVRMLVSIREEDYTSANLSIKNFRSNEIVLSFGEDEARAIYDVYDQSKFPTFEESWKSFGEAGPLMEYTYSLSVGTSLRSMLNSQVDRLVDANDDTWVYALYLASLAGSMGLKTTLSALKDCSGCASIMRFVKAVNKEHLLRGGGNGEIGPLHPYRSAIIAEVLSAYCIVGDDEVAADLVRCSMGNVGSLLVDWFGGRGGDMPKMEALAGACGGSWSKLSEVLKCAIWSDTRRTYEATSGLRAEFIRRRVSSWLPFTIGGGITKTFEVTGGDVLLKMAGDDQWRETLRGLLKEASDYQISYDAGTAVLRAIELSSLRRPDSPLEMESAGFCLAQYMAFGCVDKAVTSSAQALADGYAPSEGNLSAQLDYAMGLQLCGATLHESAYELLEYGVNERHSIVWCEKTPDSVDILQVPRGRGADLNDELVDALADFRRLYPLLERYCGAQIGTDAFVPADKMPPTEKHIPARNLPIHWLNVADRMFIEMCEYDDAMNDWDSERRTIGEALALFDSTVAGMTKWLDKCFDKGAVVSPKSGLIEDVRTMASRETQSWVTIDTPKSMRDPMGFRSLVSPVDQRGARRADEDSVRGRVASGGPLINTSKLMSHAESFGQRCCDLVLALANGERDAAERAARSGIYLLKLIIDVFHESRRELIRLFDAPIFREDLELDVVILAGVLSHLAANGIRYEHSVAYDSRLRARKLMNARHLIVESMARHPAGRFHLSKTDDDAVSVDMAGDRVYTVEEVLSEVVSNCFREFDDTEHLSEFFLFPHYCESLEVRLFYKGVYFGTVRLRGYQLEKLVGGETDILYLPSEGMNWEEDELWSAVGKAMVFIEAIKQLCLYCLSVNSAISRKERSVSHLVDSVYDSWKLLAGSEVTEAATGLHRSLTSLPQWAEPAVYMLEQLSGYFDLIPDTADASKLIAALGDLQEKLLYCCPETNGS